MKDSEKFLGRVQASSTPRKRSVHKILQKLFAKYPTVKQVTWYESRHPGESSTRLLETDSVPRNSEKSEKFLVWNFFRVGDFFWISQNTYQVKFNHAEYHTQQPLATHPNLGAGVSEILGCGNLSSRKECPRAVYPCTVFF